MIEIIREEDWETTEKKALPKDIRQIGRPDIGDRIYVENQVYQFLHPCGSRTEKAAYVLLGRFENYAGKQCTFVEAAIRLAEVKFDGEVPVWNDDTWAYLYRQLKHEYESMVIVGWALDKRGQLPQMTERMEALHLKHFGGAHQILLLMDTLEREDVFYGNKSGHLGQREGFYIYYDKKAAAGMKRAMQAAAEEEAPARREAETAGWSEETFFAEEKPEAGGEMSARTEEPDRVKLSDGGPADVTRDEARGEEDEALAKEREYEDRVIVQTKDRTPEGEHGAVQDGEVSGADSWEREKWEDVRRREEAKRKADRAGTVRGMHAAKRKSGGAGAWFGSVFADGVPGRREDIGHRQEQGTLSASSVLLLAVVCALGVTAYLNHQKMNEMEETIARMSGGTNAAAAQSTETIRIEEVAGNVQRQDPAVAQPGTDAGGQAEGAGQQNGAAQPGADAGDGAQGTGAGSSGEEAALGNGMTGTGEAGAESGGQGADAGNAGTGKQETTGNGATDAGEAGAGAGSGGQGADAGKQGTTGNGTTGTGKQGAGAPGTDAGNGMTGTGKQGTDAESGAPGTNAGNAGTGKQGADAGSGGQEVTAGNGAAGSGKQGTGAESGGQGTEAGNETAGSGQTGTDDTEEADQTAAMAEAQTYLKQGYYIVQKGDSLIGICRKVYQTTAMMDKLCEANGIDDPNAIYAGQYLTLPR